MEQSRMNNPDIKATLETRHKTKVANNAIHAARNRSNTRTPSNNQGGVLINVLAKGNQFLFVIRHNLGDVHPMTIA